MGLGAMLGLVPDVARDLVLVGACFSIMLNPLVFNQVSWLRSKPEPGSSPVLPSVYCGHVVVVGADAIGSPFDSATARTGRKWW